MTERHIPRRARVFGEITMVVAGIATAAAGGFIIHQNAEKNDNKAVAGSIIMLAGGTVTMLAGGMLAREEPEPTPDSEG